jgi:aminopeptidase N
MGWTARAGEDAEDSPLRSRLILDLADWDDAAVLARARELFDRDAAGSAALPGAIRDSAIRAAGMRADRQRFATMLARLRRAESEEDRWTYANALASGRDKGRAMELLAVTLDGTLPTNIATAIPGFMAGRSPFNELAYTFAVGHSKAYVALTGTGAFGAEDWLLANTAGQFNDASRAARLMADQRRLFGDGGTATAAQAAADIELRATVKRRDAAGLDRLLAKWRPR